MKIASKSSYLPAIGLSRRRWQAGKTTSSRQTEKLANFLAKEILKTKIKNKKALAFALTGELGTGKTTFVRGFLRGLGIRRKITSPTFVLIKRYKLQVSSFKNLYHIDCYRFKKAKEMADLGIKDILTNPQNIILIEWAEKIRGILPKNTIWLKFQHGKEENQREIFIWKLDIGN